MTEDIEIKDTFGEVIYVSMKTSFMMMTLNPNQSLEVYLYNGSTQASFHDGLSKEMFFQNFSKIYTVENRTAAKRNGSLWTHIFKFKKNGFKNLILGVRGVGVCARVYSMKVYYYFCEKRYFDSLRLPKTTSPYEGWKRVEANCSADSSPPDQVRTPSGYCGYNGTWSIEKNMGCFCKKGQEKNRLKKCSRKFSKVIDSVCVNQGAQM